MSSDLNSSPGRSAPARRDPSPGRSAPARRDPSPGRSAPARRDPSPGRSAPARRDPSPGRSAPARRDPSPGRSAPARRAECGRTLLVFCDSLSYYGPQGGLPADDPRIWPNIVAGQLGWDLELVGRIGWTCRDVWWAATQDPRAWAALPRAGAVVFATSGMDSLPSPLPTAARELIRYIRPPLVRRWVRDGYGWVQPRLSPMARSALPPRLTVEYLEMTRAAIDFNRPGIPIVASLPSVHIAPTYGHAHHGRPGTVSAITQWAARNHVPLVDLKEAVAEHVLGGKGNPDGIHWNFEAHRAVAELMLKALAEAGVPQNCGD